VAEKAQPRTRLNRRNFLERMMLDSRPAHVARTGFILKEALQRFNGTAGPARRHRRG